MQNSEASTTTSQADGDLQLPLELQSAPKPPLGTVSLKLEVVNAIHKVMCGVTDESEVDPPAAAALQVILQRTALPSDSNGPA